MAKEVGMELKKDGETNIKGENAPRPEGTEKERVDISVKVETLSLSAS